MLRNIPNKIDQVKSHEQLLLLFQDFDWTQAMLKEIIDDSSRGKYDFMYLRIGRLCNGRNDAPLLTLPQTSPITASKLN
jgi:hypothetical protein